MFSGGLKRFLGFTLIGVGLSVMTFSWYSHKTADNKFNATLKEQTSKTVELKDTDLILDSNMKVKEVTSNVSVIEIPDLGIKAPITEGVEKDNLTYSVGHFPNTAKLGETGNVALAGHSSSIYTCIFNGVDKMIVGDLINVYDNSGILHKYTLTEFKKVIPYDLSVLGKSKEKKLTLVTCSDNGTMRLCLIAKEISDAERLDLLKRSKNERLINLKGIVSEYKNSVVEVSNTLNTVGSEKTLSYSIPEFSSRYSSKGYIANINRENSVAN